MIDLETLEAAAALVRRVVPPTPQYCWPLLSRRIGAEVWVKHENHTPIGAFKIRGGLVYLDEVRRSQPDICGVVTATTGNHGQSIALAATRLGLEGTIVAPFGNSVEKNRAMVGFGARLVEAGHDFQAAYEFAVALAERESLHLVRSYDAMLVRGVASYGLELFRAVPSLDTVYVPIGLGSGICGVIAAREALRHSTEIVGVVAENAPTYALSFAAGRPVSTNSANTMAGGLAVRKRSTLSAAVRHALSPFRRRRSDGPCGSSSPTLTMWPRVRARPRSPRPYRNAIGYAASGSP